MLKQGEILFHAPNEFHAIRALDSSPNIFVISFHCASAAMAHFDKYQAVLDVTLKTYLSSIIKEAERTYIIPKNDPSLKGLKRKSNALIGGELLIQTFLEQFLIFLLRSKIQISAPSFPQEELQNDPLVQEIKTYISQHLEHNICVEDLCRKFDYSRSYLSRRFQQKTGQTLMEYITQIKIDEITNLGAVRIRLRSLLGALEQ
jgi:hypothetical protein